MFSCQMPGVIRNTAVSSLWHPYLKADDMLICSQLVNVAGSKRKQKVFQRCSRQGRDVTMLLLSSIIQLSNCERIYFYCALH